MQPSQLINTVFRRHLYSLLFTQNLYKMETTVTLKVQFTGELSPFKPKLLQNF